MKNFYRFFMVMAIILGFFYSLAGARDTWIKSYQFKNQQLTGESYYISDPTTGLFCSVTIRDGNYLQVYTVDQREDREDVSVFQNVFIFSDGFEEVIMTLEQDSDGNFIYDASDGYDVFEKNFKKYADELPPEVRKMFKGHWGIK